MQLLSLTQKQSNLGEQQVDRLPGGNLGIWTPHMSATRRYLPICLSSPSSKSEFTKGLSICHILWRLNQTVMHGNMGNYGRADAL